MQYVVIVTSKLDNTVQTKQVDAANDAAAIEQARWLKAGMADGFHQLVQAAIALPDGTAGKVIGTAE